MTLENAIAFFTQEAQSMSCMSVACGTADDCLQAQDGVADLEGQVIHQETIFDLASLTKLFTGLLVMRLREEGVLDLTCPVARYAPQFANLHDVCVEDVLCFCVGLVTPQRVDTQPTREEGLNQLFAVAPRPLGNGRAYSDMHAMVLKYVIEGATHQSYMQVLEERLLKPLGMTQTFCHVPEGLRSRCVSYDLEHRIEGSNWIVRKDLARGIPHDPKARLLNPQGEACAGHAGLFSTRGDMVRLCQGVLRGDVISSESLAWMSINRTGRLLEDGTHTQYLGAQCYVKHPNQYFSEIPAYMGSRAIGLSGFTGNHLSIDPERGIFALYLGNRVLNRLSVLVPEKGKTLTDYGLAPDGTGSVLWSDGHRVLSSVNYVHLKDDHFHQAVADALQLSK